MYSDPFTNRTLSTALQIHFITYSAYVVLPTLHNSRLSSKSLMNIISLRIKKKFLIVRHLGSLRRSA